MSKSIFVRLASNPIGRTEADIQADIRELLLNHDFGLNNAALEDQLADGTRRRIDVAAGATVIEVKRELTTLEGDLAYIEQLRGYVETRTLQTESRYNGILTDGREWWLFEHDPRSGEFERRASHHHTLNTGQALVEWLQSVLAIHQNIKPNQKHIEQYLGASAPSYQQDFAYLEALYEEVAGDPTVALKRELWARLLRSALGTSFEDRTNLFLNHTLLVIEAVSVGSAILGEPLAELAADPRALMGGNAFENAGVRNVIESDFFDWVLAAKGGEKLVSRVIHRIDVFNWNEVSHDVLKVLYESIISSEERKGLGEYYTPDWLAEGMVVNSVDKPLEQKILDPSCGSGTFIFHTVRRVLSSADEAGWDNKKALNHVQDHVYGMDIHPVSVVLARITYLLALGDRLGRERDAIWVPIHLGDSLQWSQPADGNTDTLRIETHGDDLTQSEASDVLDLDFGTTLSFPLGNIADAATFDQLVSAMTNLAKTYNDPRAKKPSVEAILNRYGLADGEDGEKLRATFTLLCDLNAQGRDSIWGYFVRNQGRPLWLGAPGRRVDVLVGNPPWVAYRFMTDSMQQKFKEASELRGLWEGGKVSTHQDLVGFFIVRAVEQYLKSGGTFAFVVPLAVFSRRQFAGFRSGKWSANLGATSEIRGHVTELWDLDNIRPRGALFPVPAGVVFGERKDQDNAHGATEVPHGFPKTKKVLKGSRARSGWADTIRNLTVEEKPNRTVDSDIEDVSPYRSRTSQGATVAPRTLFFVNEEQASNRLGQVAGKVNVVSARTKQEKQPWKSIPSLSAVVERRFLFDVHLGSTIAPFRTLEPWQAVLPISQGELLNEVEIAAQGRGLTDWWDAASKAWEENRTARARDSKMTLLDRLNFQNGLVKQLGASKYRVVYSKAGTKLASTYIDDPRAIIDTKLYWLPAKTIGEARYLTAILNAPRTTERVSDFQSRGLFGARDFDMYVWNLLIPLYDSVHQLHGQLADLGQECEGVASEVEIEGAQFQSARRRIRDQLDARGLLDKLDEAVSELIPPQA